MAKVSLGTDEGLLPPTTAGCVATATANARAVSYEFRHALKAQGVKTKFIIYPNEGHLFRDPKHVVDLTLQTDSWFHDHLQK